ncbi:MAG: sigma-E factor regulatory protein RseB domain-containing protein [Armatimonadota bacterium]|nr:sigma-E factor regulatory protein RseB domain-containing protein [Armatimonadota bacterium]
MRRVSYILAALAVAALFVVWIQTQVLPTLSDATRTVVAAANADRTQSYTADVRTKTMYRGKWVTVESKVYHSPKVERIEYSGGHLAGAIVVNQGNKSYTRRHGSSSVAVTELATPAPSADRIGLLLKNYSATPGGRARVAGRDVNIVDLTPRTCAGPSKRLWIDTQTYVTLRTDDKDMEGRLISSSEFRRVTYGSPMSADMPRIPSGKQIETASVSAGRDAASLSRRLGFRVTLPKYVSRGYTLEGYRLHACPCRCGHESAHIVYTNGVDTISVFETRKLHHCGVTKACDPHPGAAGQCLMNKTERGAVAVAQRGAKTVVVVGSVDPSELMRIAESTD